MLKRHGHTVHVATTVSGALAVAQTETFDVLVSDVGLPDASGYDLMRKLRETSTIKGIAITGSSGAHEEQRGREAGFSAHLIKPVSVRRLEQELEALTRWPVLARATRGRLAVSPGRYRRCMIEQSTFEADGLLACVGDQVLVCEDSLVEVARRSPSVPPTWRFLPATTHGKLIGWRERDERTFAVVDVDGEDRRLVVFVSDTRSRARRVRSSLRHRLLPPRPLIRRTVRAAAIGQA